MAQEKMKKKPIQVAWKLVLRWGHIFIINYTIQQKKKKGDEKSTWMKRIVVFFLIFQNEQEILVIWSKREKEM